MNCDKKHKETLVPVKRLEASTLVEAYRLLMLNVRQFSVEQLEKTSIMISHVACELYNQHSNEGAAPDWWTLAGGGPGCTIRSDFGMSGAL